MSVLQHTASRNILHKILVTGRATPLVRISSIQNLNLAHVSIFTLVLFGRKYERHVAADNKQKSKPK